MDVVATRLHVRSYTNQPVGKESIRELLQAAMVAHSEGDQRPWHFVVVEDLATRERIADTYPTAHIVVQAPVVIIVCGDQMLQKHPGFWVQKDRCCNREYPDQGPSYGTGCDVVWHLSR